MATVNPVSKPGIQPYGYNPSYGYPQQQQQQYTQQQQHPIPTPNSTTTPYASMYPVPVPSSALPLHYQANGTMATTTTADRGVEEGEKGFLDMAKGWMQTAGDKLVKVEAEVWRRINEAHGESENK